MKYFEQKKLGEVTKIENNTIDAPEISPETPYVGLEHIEPFSGGTSYSTAHESGVKSTKNKFTDKHVLFGKLRPYLAKVARPNFSGVCSTDIITIKPEADLDKNYLFHFLTHPSTISTTSARTTGANLPRLSPKELAKITIPIPSRSTQARIGEILDLAGNIKTKRRRSIKLLDELTQSVFLDMFDSSSSEWPTTTVQDIAEPVKGSIRTGPFGSQLLHDEFVDEGIPVLGIDNAVDNEFKWGKDRFITERKYQQLSRYTVKPGDVLITIMGTCGRCAVVPEDIPTAINTKHLCCITLDRQKCLPEFLHSYFLMHPSAQSYLHKKAKGAIMSGLNMGIIKDLPIALPPLELQQRYVDRGKAISEQKKRAEAHLSYLDELFASVQQRAFDGTLWDARDITA